MFSTLSLGKIDVIYKVKYNEITDPNNVTGCYKKKIITEVINVNDVGFSRKDLHLISTGHRRVIKESLAVISNQLCTNMTKPDYRLQTLFIKAKVDMHSWSGRNMVLYKESMHC